VTVLIHQGTGEVMERMSIDEQRYINGGARQPGAGERRERRCLSTGAGHLEGRLFRNFDDSEGLRITARTVLAARVDQVRRQTLFAGGQGLIDLGRPLAIGPDNGRSHGTAHMPVLYFFNDDGRTWKTRSGNEGFVANPLMERWF